MNRATFKEDLRHDVDSYGKPKKLMSKIDSVFDYFENALRDKNNDIKIVMDMSEHMLKELESERGIREYLTKTFKERISQLESELTTYKTRRYCTQADFEYEYQQIPTCTEPYKRVCGECIYFQGMCTTSRLEAKYGMFNTPACSEFLLKDCNDSTD